MPPHDWAAGPKLWRYNRSASARRPDLVVLQCQIESLLDRKLGHAVNGHYPMRITSSQEMAQRPLSQPCFASLISKEDAQVPAVNAGNVYPCPP